MQLRPSKSHQWTRCAAVPTFEARVPEEPPSDAAREGTCAAWVADCVLKGEVSTAADMNGRSHENGWLVTPDMCEHVQGYIDMIRSRGGVIVAEQYVRLTDNIAGTLDCSTSLSSGLLCLDDLKYGMRIVEVFDNTQCVIYAGAELMRLNDPTITHVRLGIYQPRAFHPDGIYRTVTLTVAELWQKVQWIIDRAQLCLEPTPIATPGPQCADCRGQTTCIANGWTTYQAFSVIEDRRQHHMTATEAAQEWLFLEQAVRLIESRFKAFDAEILQRMRTEHFPGIFLEVRKGHRKFKVDPAIVHAWTGIKPTKEVPITPAELERQGAPLEIVKQLTETPDVGHKLKRVPHNYFEKVFHK